MNNYIQDQDEEIAVSQKINETFMQILIFVIGVWAGAGIGLFIWWLTS